MRVPAFIIATTVCIVMAPTLASAASARVCSELRLACTHRDALGEQGLGNCEKYRQTCERPLSCSQLRYRCLHKDAYAAQGQGLCEAYRQSCR
jgi:hypothetical protein